MASIWSSHLLPSLPLTTLRSLPAEECLPPDLPTLLPLTRCCHQEDWCMRHLSPRHYCQVSMTQDKGAGIYLRQRRAPLMWGPQDVLEMQCRDTQTFCTSSAWVQQGLLALAQHQPCWTWAASQTGPLKCLHIVLPSSWGLRGFISLGILPDMHLSAPL